MNTDTDNLKILAHLYNEQFTYKYIPSFEATPININVIRYENIGKDNYFANIIAPIIRVSALRRENYMASWQMKELKWEGYLNVWWQAVADNANQFKNIYKG